MMMARFIEVRFAFDIVDDFMFKNLTKSMNKYDYQIFAKDTKFFIMIFYKIVKKC